MKARIAAVRFGSPAKKLRVIGVTGTDGKTTTVAMISHILHAAGKKVGASSSAFLEKNGQRRPNATQKTSLPPFALQRFLRELANDGCEFAVLEASSHGLVQGRLIGITPEIAVITNTSMEHLDYHGSMDAYVAAKSLLFRSMRGNGTKILNRDDGSFEMMSMIPTAVTLTFGNSDTADMIVQHPHADASGSKAMLSYERREYPLELSIPGTFNLQNAAAAILAARAAGVPIEQSIAALKTFHGAPGRMEKIDEGQAFSVYIDFTVTPVAYEKTLSSIRESLAPGKKLLVLTGSCGDRMHEKRPLVGKICGEKADVVVVTNEDPYTEDPEKIINEVFAGIPQDLPVFDPSSHQQPPHLAFAVRISDRLDAIKFLLRHAQPGDAILFAGKGGDVTMMTAHGQIPWDEAAIVRQELKNLGATR